MRPGLRTASTSRPSPSRSCAARGIDQVALAHLASRHDPADVVFVDVRPDVDWGDAVQAAVATATPLHAASGLSASGVAVLGQAALAGINRDWLNRFVRRGSVTMHDSGHAALGFEGLSRRPLELDRLPGQCLPLLFGELPSQAAGPWLRRRSRLVAGGPTSRVFLWGHASTAKVAPEALFRYSI